MSQFQGTFRSHNKQHIMGNFYLFVLIYFPFNMQNLYHTYSFYYNKPKLKNYEKIVLTMGKYSIIQHEYNITEH